MAVVRRRLRVCVVIWLCLQVAPALVFWGALLDAPPVRARTDDLHRAMWFAAAMVPGWILAIVLAFASAPVYAAYPSLTDQAVAAGVMWVPGSLS